MNSLRHRSLRLPIVAIAVLGWLALSNHCALAAHGTSKMPMTCHGSAANNHAPAKQGKEGRIECCKVLRATLLDSAKSVASLDQSLFTPYKHFIGVVVLPDAAQQNGVLEWDTGPPFVGSFAESVLQRSILAHAPPSPA